MKLIQTGPNEFFLVEEIGGGQVTGRLARGVGKTLIVDADHEITMPSAQLLILARSWRN